MSDISDDASDRTPVNLMPKRQDLIIVGEFSEITGPVPLFTVPSIADPSFDQSAFIERALSCDIQPKLQDQGFELSDDAQMYMADAQTGRYAYVHYFALNDIQARGLSRLFCMAYITCEPQKIMRHFAGLVADFNRVSRMVKYSNRQQFAKEVRNKVQNLLLTRDHWKASERQPSSDDVQALDARLAEMQQVLDALEPCLDDERMARLVSADDTSTASTKGDSTVRPSSRVRRTQSFLQRNQAIRRTNSTSFDAGRDRTHSSASSRSSDYTRRRSGSIGSAPKDLDQYIPRLEKFDQAPALATSLRSLEEIAPSLYAKATKKLKRVLRHYGRNDRVLALEQSEANMLHRSESLLTIGRCVVINFEAGEDSSFASLASSDTISTFSFDSINGASSGMRSVAQPLYSPQLFRKSFLGGSTSRQSSRQSSVVPSPPLATSSQSSSPLRMAETRDSSAFFPPADPIALAEDEEDSDEDATGEWFHTDYLDSSSPISQSLYLDALDSVSVAASSPVDSETASFSSCLDEPQQRDRTSSVASADSLLLSGVDVPPPSQAPRSKYPYQSSADHVMHPSRAKPGAGVLKFLRTSTCATHIVYSLLKGRTVVVLGSKASEHKVRQLVTALWLFVPGHSTSHTVEHWREDQLRLRDLHRVRLCGLCRAPKKRVISATIQRHVTIVDVDKDLYLGPKYTEGRFVHRMVSFARRVRTEATLHAHLHVVFQELGQRAFLFYHDYYTRPTDRLDRQEQDMFNDQEQMSSFFEDIDVHGCDQSIVEYLTETVVEQQCNALSNRYGHRSGTACECEALAHRPSIAQLSTALAIRITLHHLSSDSRFASVVLIALPAAHGRLSSVELVSAGQA